MKRFLAAFAAVCFALLLSVSALPPRALAIGEVMNAARGTPWIDGEIDPVWKRADRQKISHITGGEGKRADSIAWVSALWDDEALYFLFEISDNDFTFEAEPGSDLNDSIYLYIDERDFFGETWYPGQTRVALTPALGKSVYNLNGEEPRDYEMAFGFDEDGHALIEFRYVPHHLDLPNAGRVLMDFQYNDASPEGFVETRFNWSDELGECETDSASWTYITLKKGSSASSGEGYATLEEAAEAIRRTPVNYYQFRDGTEGNHHEGPRNLWDGDVGTKFCTSTFSMKSVVRLKSAMVIDGVIMATANDNSAYHGRNPDEWKIQGSSNGEDWEDILTGDESFFENVDFTYFAAPVEDAGPYRYIRFYNRSCKSGCCQVSEVAVCHTEDALKNAPQEEEIVHDPAEKDSLVNYESKARLSLSVPAEAAEVQPESPAPASAAAVPAKTFSPVPGIVAAAVCIVFAAGAALILPKKLNE